MDIWSLTLPAANEGLAITCALATNESLSARTALRVRVYVHFVDLDCSSEKRRRWCRSN